MAKYSVMTPSTNLNGKGTTITGILAILGGAFGLLSQIWGAIHGGQIDPGAATSSLGTITAGVGLVKAADQKQ